MSAAVTVSAEGGILTLTLARPEKKNALTQQMYGALADQLERANDDETIKVVVLRGEGADFCAGNDLADFATRTDPAHPGNGALCAAYRGFVDNQVSTSRRGRFDRRKDW